MEEQITCHQICELVLKYLRQQLGDQNGCSKEDMNCYITEDMLPDFCDYDLADGISEIIQQEA